MARYRVIETQPATSTWTHYVDAESQEEAIEKVLTGKTEKTYYEVVPDDDQDIVIDDIEEVDSLDD